MAIHFFDRMIFQKTSSFLSILFFCWKLGLCGSKVDWAQFPCDLFVNYLVPVNFKDFTCQKDSDLKGKKLFIGTTIVDEKIPEGNASRYKFKPLLQINLVTGKIVLFRPPEFFSVCKKWRENSLHAESVECGSWVEFRLCLQKLDNEVMLKKAFNYPFLNPKQIKDRCDLMVAASGTGTGLMCFERSLELLQVSAPYAFILAAVTAIKRVSCKNVLKKNLSYLEQIRELFFGNIDISTFGDIPHFIPHLLFLVTRASVFLFPFVNDNELKEVVKNIQSCVCAYKKSLACHQAQVKSYETKKVDFINKKYPILELNKPMSNLFEHGYSDGEAFITSIKNAFKEKILAEAIEDVFINIYRFNKDWTKEELESFKQFNPNQKLAFFYFKVMLNWDLYRLDQKKTELSVYLCLIQKWIFSAAIMAISLHFGRFLPQLKDFPDFSSPLQNPNLLLKLLVSCGDNLNLFFDYLRYPAVVSQTIAAAYAEEKKRGIKITDEMITEKISQLVPSFNVFFEDLTSKSSSEKNNSVCQSSVQADYDSSKVIADLKIQIEKMSNQLARQVQKNKKLAFQVRKQEKEGKNPNSKKTTMRKPKK